MIHRGFPGRAVSEVSRNALPYQVRFDPEVGKVAALNLVNKEGVRLRLHS